MSEPGGMDMERVLAQIKPKTATVRVCLRGDLLAQHDALEAELARVRREDAEENRHAQAPEVAAKVQALEAEIDAAETSLTFAAIGQLAWTNLLEAHRPTEEDKADGYEFNPRTFPPVAVAASAVEPRMTVEQAQRLYAALNFGQWEKVWGTCLAVNVVGTSVPFSAAASATLRGYETKSDSPTATASPAVNS